MSIDEAVFSPERYRPLVRLLARRLEIELRFARRFDSSDLVQETMLKAHEGLPAFRGGTEQEWIGWLHQILVNVAADQLRRATADKRDIALERSLEEFIADSNTHGPEELIARDLTPAGRAQLREEALRLAAAIDRLPPDQREVIVERDLNGLPVKAIAEKLQRTEKSIAGLLLRARQRLREELG